MKDTNISSTILQVFAKGAQLSSSEVADLTPSKQSLVTVKRQLGALLKSGYLDQSGAGRSVKYTLSKKGWLLKPIDLRQYLKQDPDVRLKIAHFQFDVFEPPYVPLFTPDELIQLEAATSKFRDNARQSDAPAHKKETYVIYHVSIV